MQQPELFENVVAFMAIYTAVLTVVVVALCMLVNRLTKELTRLSSDFGLMQNTVIRELGKTSAPTVTAMTHIKAHKHQGERRHRTKAGYEYVR